MLTYFERERERELIIMMMIMMILLIIIKPRSKFGEEWGDELLNWVGMFTDVVYGEVSVWVGMILAKILILLLGWGIE